MHKVKKNQNTKTKSLWIVHISPCQTSLIKMNKEIENLISIKIHTFKTDSPEQGTQNKQINKCNYIKLKSFHIRSNSSQDTQLLVEDPGFQS